MAYVLGNATAPTSNTVPLFIVPPGLVNVTFWNASGNTVYIGTSTAVTSTNGLQCHSIPTSFFSYIGSKGATFFGANTSGVGASINYILVTDQ